MYEACRCLYRVCSDYCKACWTLVEVRAVLTENKTRWFTLLTGQFMSTPVFRAYRRLHSIGFQSLCTCIEDWVCMSTLKNTVFFLLTAICSRYRQVIYIHTTLVVHA